MESLTASSEHFTVIYWDEDAHIIGKILELLENNYNRITSFLQVELLEKSVLHIYPSIDKFHAGIGRVGAPDWVAGYFDEDSKIISIVSPNNPGTEHIRKSFNISENDFHKNWKEHLIQSYS